MRKVTYKAAVFFIAVTMLFLSLPMQTNAQTRQEKRKQAMKDLQKRFEWWPTDAQPGPVKDEKRGGYWWWPKTPGKITPWGNRGYIYVNKIITQPEKVKLPPVQEKVMVEERIPTPNSSLLIKDVVKNVKVYFDYDKAFLREDHVPILSEAVRALLRSPECDILITGNCDKRGSNEYNLKLGRKRAEAVRQFMLSKGIPDRRIRIISRGKLDAIAPLTDLSGMQKDRNAHFIIAEVEEVEMPYDEKLPSAKAAPLGEGRFLIKEEKDLESGMKVATKKYLVQKKDTLWKIAEREMGGGHRWQYLYQLNIDRIKNPNILSVGSPIVIPIE